MRRWYSSSFALITTCCTSARLNVHTRCWLFDEACFPRESAAMFVTSRSGDACVMSSTEISSSNGLNSARTGTGDFEDTKKLAVSNSASLAKHARLADTTNASRNLDLIGVVEMLLRRLLDLRIGGDGRSNKSSVVAEKVSTPSTNSCRADGHMDFLPRGMFSGCFARFCGLGGTQIKLPTVSIFFRSRQA